MPFFKASSIPVTDPSALGNSQEEQVSKIPLVPYFGKLWRQLANRLDGRFPFSLSLKILAVVFALTWYAFLPVRLSSINDPDLGWHLRSGEWIIQHHSLPHTDPFSATGAGKPWVAYSWSFGVLIYEVAKNFDLLGVAAYTLFAWMAINFALFRLARSRGAGLWPAIGITLPAGAVLQRVISPRPGTITILLFVVLLNILLKERARGYTRRLWIVPVLFWIWANVHVQFVYGLFLIGIFCMEPVLDWFFVSRQHAHKLTARLWAVLMVSTAATLLNPYGFGPYHVLIDFARQSKLASYGLETQAMPFTIYLDYFVLFLALGAAFVLGWRKRVQPLWVILLVWGAMSSFRFERDIWLVTTIAVAMIAGRSPNGDRKVAEPSRLWLYAALGVIVVSFVMLKRVPSNRDLLSSLATRMPVGAVAYIHEHHLSGPLFNNYDWGGFLIYALPKIPVSIDGRTNVHGQDEVGQSIRTWTLAPGWDNDPLLNQANLVIGDPHYALTSYLRKDLHFKVVYDDGVCVLFERVLPGKLGLTH